MSLKQKTPIKQPKRCFQTAVPLIAHLAPLSCCLSQFLSSCLQISSILLYFVIKKATLYLQTIHFTTSSYPIHSTDPDFIPQDLNEDSKAQYIYAFKQMGEDPTTAVSNFYFVQNNTPVPATYEKLPQDLNDGAGGTYNYLCVQKGVGPAVTDITIKSYDHPVIGEPLPGWTIYPQDLNTGAEKEGKFLYLFYKK